MLAVLAAALGAVVQGVSGVGGGFIVVPLLAMINVNFLPGPLVVASISISGLMVWREQQHIDYANTRFILLGTAIGAVLGAWLVSGIVPDRLGLVFGSMILIGVLITGLGMELPLNRVSATIAGTGAGAMGAASGIGAPVLAVLYQRETGPRVRATLAYIYTVASVLIAAVLALLGRLTLDGIGYAMLLVPGFVLGYFMSRRITKHFDHGAMRYVVLGVSAVAALSLIYRSSF